MRPWSQYLGLIVAGTVLASCSGEAPQRSLAEAELFLKGVQRSLE